MLMGELVFIKVLTPATSLQKLNKLHLFTFMDSFFNFASEPK